MLSFKAFQKKYVIRVHCARDSASTAVRCGILRIPELAFCLVLFPRGKTNKRPTKSLLYKVNDILIRKTTVDFQVFAFGGYKAKTEDAVGIFNEEISDARGGYSHRLF